MKEAFARIKINKLLEVAGWRFFADSNGPANIQLEPGVTLVTQSLDDLGENFEKTSKGFIDFLLLNEKGFPFIVLEAKAEGLSPLVGKEQARKYAKAQNCRFVILSNGNLHYFWDLERGNARAVFDYFIGYKLGLTATPFDYLKKFDKEKPTTKDPREFERRLMLDTRTRSNDSKPRSRFRRRTSKKQSPASLARIPRAPTAHRHPSLGQRPRKHRRKTHEG